MKLGIIGRDWRASAVSLVVNEVGEVKEDEEAVDVWKRHFEKIMNSGSVAEESSIGSQRTVARWASSSCWMRI